MTWLTCTRARSVTPFGAEHPEVGQFLDNLAVLLPPRAPYPSCQPFWNRLHGSSGGQASRRASKLFNPGASAILVFLCGPTANAAGTDQDTLAEDRHGALAIEYVVAFCRGDAAQGWMVGTWRQIATRASKSGRGHGLALAAEGASPHGAIHTLKGKEPSAGVAHGNIHLGADLVCLLDGAGNHAIGIRKGEGHEVNPFRSGTHQDARASRVAGRPGHQILLQRNAARRGLGRRVRSQGKHRRSSRRPLRCHHADATRSRWTATTCA